MKPWNPSDEVKNIFKRMNRDGATSTQPRIAMDLARNKRIRILRQQDKFFIGQDRRKHKSILYCKVKFRIDESGIHFD